MTIILEGVSLGVIEEIIAALRITNTGDTRVTSSGDTRICRVVING